MDLIKENFFERSTRLGIFFKSQQEVVATDLVCKNIFIVWFDLS